MLACLETVQENRRFEELAQEANEWNIDLIKDNFWNGFILNDRKALADTNQMVYSTQRDLEMKRAILQRAIDHLKTVYHPNALE